MLKNLLEKQRKKKRMKHALRMAPAAMQDPPHPNGTCDSEQASQDEQTAMNPPPVSVAHQAQIVTCDVKSGTGECLDQTDDRIDGVCSHAADQEGSCLLCDQIMIL